MDESENEVIEELGENPMRAYKLQFPYQVKFCLAGDDHRTEVIINTISEEMTFARTKKDALLQKERNDAVSKDGYTRHIVVPDALQTILEGVCTPPTSNLRGF